MPKFNFSRKKNAKKQKKFPRPNLPTRGIAEWQRNAFKGEGIIKSGLRNILGARIGPNRTLRAEKITDKIKADNLFLNKDGTRPNLPTYGVAEWQRNAFEGEGKVKSGLRNILGARLGPNRTLRDEKIAQQIMEATKKNRSSVRSSRKSTMRNSRSSRSSSRSSRSSRSSSARSVSSRRSSSRGSSRRSRRISTRV